MAWETIKGVAGAAVDVVLLPAVAVDVVANKIANKIMEEGADPESMIANAVRRMCSFNNDTDYEVTIIRHDGTFDLVPGDEIGQWIFRGFAIDLVIKFPTGKTEKIEFPSSRYENRVHKISEVFYEEIKTFEQEQPKPPNPRSEEPNLSMFDDRSKPIRKTTDKLDLERHFKQVRAVAWEARAKWEDLTTELELGVGTRDEIKTTYSGDVDMVGKCFTAMIEKWLMRAHPPPTWAALLEALGSRVVDRRDLAAGIKDWLLERNIK